MSWQGKTIAIPGQVAQLPQKRQHVGTSRTPTGAGAPERVSPSSPHQTYKNRNAPRRKASPILASPSTYQTHSHYTLNSPALYWNLPPPTWNLNNVDSS